MAGFWDRVDTLEIVELYAEDNGKIASEQELSDLFDSEVLPSVLAQYGKGINRLSMRHSMTGPIRSAKMARFTLSNITTTHM